MPAPKFIFDANGVMKLNPAYQKDEAKKGNVLGQTVADPKQALAVVSTPEDVAAASEAQMKTGKGPTQMADATVATMQIMQDEDYLNKFQAGTQLDGGELLEGLTKEFGRYEIPIGLTNKLLALSEYGLNFIVDDSGSMNSKTDVAFAQASPAMRNEMDPKGKRASDKRSYMTRFEEAEDRLHIMIDLLKFIPTNDITIRFLNRNETVKLDHHGKTPEQFAEDAHKRIRSAFKHSAAGMTPIFKHLVQAFGGQSNTMHYLLTDGEPSDASTEKVSDLILRRMNPKAHPLTFITCTENDDEAQWMKDIEGEADYVAELDDFITERKEVSDAQGPAFPFTRGFWLLAHLVAAINPDDLDALDENTLTKKSLDNLLGRVTTGEEYQHYFNTSPMSAKVRNHYQAFATENKTAKAILGQGGQQSHYGSSSSSMYAASAPQQTGYSAQQSSHSSHHRFHR